MARDPPGRNGQDPPAVLEALADADCRTIISCLGEPMTAKEIAASADLALSTAYRKLDLLTEAELLDERPIIQSDGHHTTAYHLDFESVSFALDDDRHLDVSVDRPPGSTEERLIQLWSEVRKET